MSNKYDEDYFLNGQKTGKSLYLNYRWMPDLTVPMAKRIIEHLDIRPGDRVTDFGCSRGYLVKAFGILGVEASGVDVSDWAVANCDEDVRGKVKLGSKVTERCEWIVAKDCLEHLGHLEVLDAIDNFAENANSGFFIVVPLSGHEDKYVVPEYEQDITHQIRWPMHFWVSNIQSKLDERWSVESRYRIPGIKDNYSHFPKGNGFITARRITS